MYIYTQCMHTYIYIAYMHIYICISIHAHTAWLQQHHMQLLSSTIHQTHTLHYTYTHKIHINTHTHSVSTYTYMLH